MSALPSLERMRAEVAEILGMEPSEIGDDVDLTDLGLDSVRIMTLAEGWSRGEVQVDFSDLVEDPRLSHWRIVLAARFGEDPGAS